MAVSDAYVFPGFLTPVLTQLFFPKPDYFSHMLLQRWEVKIRRKEKSPQPGIELTTTRSWVRHAHHWSTRAGGLYSKGFINITVFPKSSFNPLSKDKILDWFKLKTFADDKINVTQKQKFSLGWVESIREKEKMPVTGISSPFSTMFSKGFLLRVVKSYECLVKS